MTWGAKHNLETLGNHWWPASTYILGLRLILGYVLSFRNLWTSMYEVIFCWFLYTPTTEHQTLIPRGSEANILYRRAVIGKLLRVQNWKTLKFMTMKSFLQYHLIYRALNQYLSSLLGDCMMVSFLSSTKDCKKEENLQCFLFIIFLLSMQDCSNCDDQVSCWSFIPRFSFGFFL